MWLINSKLFYKLWCTQSYLVEFKELVTILEYIDILEFYYENNNNNTYFNIIKDISKYTENSFKCAFVIYLIYSPVDLSLFVYFSNICWTASSS